MTEPLPVDLRVARMVAAGSLTTLVAMLLVTGATLAGAGRGGDPLGDIVLLVVALVGSLDQRPSSPLVVRAAAALAVLGAVAVAAVLGVFAGFQGPDPGVAVFAWTRMLVALVIATAALSTLWRLRRVGPEATASGLWGLGAGYWLSCVAVGYLA